MLRSEGRGPKWVQQFYEELDILQVDLRVVPQESYGAALFCFAGSKEHNLALRNMALDRGLMVNEYGVFRERERIAGEDVLSTRPWADPKELLDRSG